ncbi:MAG TPA: helix-turn-helix transcriptional regulator [Kineosporiaceae bacterium]
MTASIASQIDHWRGVRGLSAQKLADRTAELGFPVPRNTIANLENNRRTTITVAELFVLAFALDVPVVMLLLPVGRATQVEIVPGEHVPIYEAVSRVAGDPTMIGYPRSPEYTAALGRLHRLRLFMAAQRKIIEATVDTLPTRPDEVRERAQESLPQAQMQLDQVRDLMRAAGDELPFELLNIRFADPKDPGEGHA